MEALNRIANQSESKSEIVRKIRLSNKVEFLTAGNDRVVGSIRGNKICKISLNTRQNEKEVKISEREDKIRYYTCPVIRYDDDFRWIVSPKLNFDVERSLKVSFLKELTRETGKFPCDFTVDDIGRIENKLLIADYGYGFKNIEDDFSVQEEI